MCGLEEEHILAIAEHEHIPEIAAAALANYLLHQEQGAEKIRDMIVDDIQNAYRRNDYKHMQELMMALRHFTAQFPEVGQADV